MFVKNTISVVIFGLLLHPAIVRCESQENIRWLTWDDSKEGTPPEVEVIESDADSTTFQIVIHGFFLEKLERDTNQGRIEFSRILLPRDMMSNHGTLMEPGRPELPVIRRFIAILSDAEEAVILPEGYEIDELSVGAVEGVVVYPFQPLSSEQYPKLQFIFDEKAYESPACAPFDYSAPPRLTFEPAVFHRLKVVRVDIYPFTYVPAERLLRVYGRFRVRVAHPGEVSEVLPVTASYERTYASLLANYGSLKPLLPPTLPGRCGAYLIIAPDKYYSNVLPLASWKRAKGLRATIQTMPSQFPNTATDIKKTIAAFYKENPCGDLFVLLVGDIEDVASPTCEAYEWNALRSDCSSDIQYARVAGNDAIPDLFVGRIPADDAEDVDNVVGKILAYEKMSAGEDKEWLRKALLVAHKQDYPARYTACKESIRSYPYSFATPIFDTANGGEGATNSVIRNAFEEGRGIVNYRGHGGTDSWWTWAPAGQSWYISPDVINLTNGEKTPIIFGIADLNNHLKSNDSIGEEFVETAGGGAVAYYGASADTGTVANDHLDKSLFKAAFDEQIETLGAIANWAQVRTMEELPGAGAFSSEYNANIYLLLGDPEMSIRTRPPLIFGSVEYKEWVNAGAQDVQVAVKNENGGPIRNALAIVRKFRGASASPDVDASGYTGGDGKVTLGISPTTQGGLTVTVLKQDYVPYEGDGTLRIIHTERIAEDGSFSLSWQIDPGKNYAVYVSETLGADANWRLLGIAPRKDGLTMTLTDTTSGLVQSRFYRVQTQ